MTCAVALVVEHFVDLDTIRHEFCWLLGRRLAQLVLRSEPEHAKVRSGDEYLGFVRYGLDARHIPGGRCVRMFVYEIATSPELLAVHS